MNRSSGTPESRGGIRPHFASSLSGTQQTPRLGFAAGSVDTEKGAGRDDSLMETNRDVERRAERVRAELRARVSNLLKSKGNVADTIAAALA